MLCPAIIYKDEICNKFKEYYYSNDMLNYNGCLFSSVPQISEEPSDSVFQYAIVDKGEVVGYFCYQINWYAKNAFNFGLFSFDRKNKIVGVDVYRELKKLIKEYRLHRIEWRMVGDNPVEKHYDKFCKKYNGRKYVLRDAVKDKYGNYHNDVIYEIVFECNNGHLEELLKWI